MKRLLILGGSHSELPLIVEAKKLGFFVYSLGNKEDIGHKFSNEFIKEDYSDKNKILEIIKNKNIDFVLFGCNDFSIKSAAYAAKFLKKEIYDDIKTTETIHNKDLFKMFANEFNISVPKNYTYEDVEFPVIVKPIDLSGGKGIKIVNSYVELDNAIKNILNISREKKYVIEEYIEGEHYSCFVFVFNKSIKIKFFAKEYFYKNKFLVNGAFSVFNLNKKITEKLEKDINIIINKLNLKNGILHVQFVVKDFKPYILEITRRCPGDLYLKLIDYSLGINISEIIVKNYTELLREDDFNITFSKKLIMRHCLMTDKNGIFEHIKTDKKLNIIDYFPLKCSGDKIENYLLDKVGITFCEYQDNFEKNINNLIYPKVENV